MNRAPSLILPLALLAGCAHGGAAPTETEPAASAQPTPSATETATATGTPAPITVVAGEVFTLTAALEGGDGLVRTAAGDFLVSQPQQHTVKRVSPEGVVSDFADGLTEAYGMSLDSHGDLYIADWGARMIKKITPEGVVSDFAAVDGRPGNVFVDAQDNIYIPHFYKGKLDVITPEGERSTIAQLPANEGFHGVMVDASGQLYAGMHLSGKLYKIHADGGYEDFARLPGQFGNMLLFDGHVFVTGYDTHQVYVVGPAGGVALLAGSGAPADADGAALDAGFVNPNGLVGDAATRTLYVSESGGSLRGFVLEDPS